MRLGHKVALVGIFCLGGFTTITGILRLLFSTKTYDGVSAHNWVTMLRKFSPVNLPKSAGFDAFTTDNFTPISVWSIIETNTGVVCACLPTLRPLLQAYSLAPILSKITRFRHRSSVPPMEFVDQHKLRLSKGAQVQVHPPSNGTSADDIRLYGVSEDIERNLRDHLADPSVASSGMYVETTRPEEIC